MASTERFTPAELAVLQRELNFRHGVVSVHAPLERSDYLWPGTWIRGLYRFIRDLYSR